MALLARQRFRIPVPLALQLPYRVRVRGGTVGQKFPYPKPLRGNPESTQHHCRLSWQRPSPSWLQTIDVLDCSLAPSQKAARPEGPKSYRLVVHLTHGPSPNPDPKRKLKGKGQGDPKPLAREQCHSQDNVSIHLELYVLRSLPSCTECSEGELWGRIEGRASSPKGSQSGNEISKFSIFEI